MIVDCTDSKAGRLLHSYELGALEEPDLSTFEQHLLNCDACFQALEDWENNISLVRHDPEFAHAAATAVQDSDKKPRPSIWSRLWPRDRSILFRPGLAYFAALGVLILMLIANLPESRNGVEKAQVIYLTSLRDVQANKYVVRQNEPLVISFHVGRQWANQPIDLTLTCNGSLLFADSTTGLLDNLGTGTLLLQSNKIKTGSYRLLLVTSGQELGAVNDTLDFTFQVSFH